MVTDPFDTQLGDEEETTQVPDTQATDQPTQGGEPGSVVEPPTIDAPTVVKEETPTVAEIPNIDGTAPAKTDTTADTTADTIADTTEEEVDPYEGLSEEQTEALKAAGYNEEDFDPDWTALGMEVDEKGNPVFTPLSFDEEISDIEKASKIQLRARQEAALASQQGQMGAINQMLAQNEMQGDGIGSSYFRSSARDINRQLSTDSLNITKMASDSINNLKVRQKEFNARAESEFERFVVSTELSLDKEERDFRLQVFKEQKQLEQEEELAALNNFYSVYNSIEDPQAAIDFLLTGADMFPDDEFLQQIMNDETFKQQVLNSKYSPELKEQAASAAAAILTQIDWENPNSVEMGRQQYYDQIKLQKGGDEGILQEFWDVIKSGNVTDEFLTDIFGGSVAYVGNMSKDNLEPFLNKYMDQLFKNGKQKNEDTETEELMLKDFKEYATDSVTEKAISDSLLKAWSNGQTGMTFSLDGQGRIQIDNIGEFNGDPASVPSLSVFYTDWDGNDYKGDYAYGGDSVPDEYKELDKMWMEYTKNLPKDSTAISRDEFKEMFYNEEYSVNMTLGFGVKAGATTMYNPANVSDKNLDGQSPAMLARGEKPPVIDEETGAQVVTALSTEEQVSQALESSIKSGKNISDALKDNYTSSQLDDDWSAYKNGDSTRLDTIAASLGINDLKKYDAGQAPSVPTGNGDWTNGTTGINAGDWVVFESNGKPVIGKIQAQNDRKKAGLDRWGERLYRNQVIVVTPDGDKVELAASEPYDKD